MFDPAIIFQRTQAGKDEIQQKSHGLTQSERLVLIMIDGATAYQGIRNKLPVLTDARFDRALTKLLQKELVCEVFLPVEGIGPEEIERSVIDRFLQQDPMDPLTILFIDPDEQFGDMIAESAPTKPVAPAYSNPADFAPVQAVITAPDPQGAMNEEDIRIADTLAEEVRALNATRPVRVEPIRRMDIESEPSEKPAAAHARFKVSDIHWGYWLMALGFAFIAGFFLAKLSV